MELWTQYRCGDLKMTTAAEGGQVRFGEYAMELNYDYESYDGSKNSNYYVRYCGDQIKIEGTPTEIGVWIYAPETRRIICSMRILNTGTAKTTIIALRAQMVSLHDH